MIREVFWRGLWFRFSGFLYNNKSWKVIVLIVVYLYNRGLIILIVWLFLYVVNIIDNKWIYFDKKIKINIWNLIFWYCFDKLYVNFLYILIYKGILFCLK